MQQSVKVPAQRLAVVIGQEGQTRRDIEQATHTTLVISDDVTIGGEALDVISAANIVTAIGRGFSPETALLLASEEQILEVIAVDQTLKARKRTFARIIGRKGATKKRIEDETGAALAVYGKTVSIIGTSTAVDHARRAVQMLIDGRSHASVYAQLKKMV